MTPNQYLRDIKKVATIAEMQEFIKSGFYFINKSRMVWYLEWNFETEEPYLVQGYYLASVIDEKDRPWHIVSTLTSSGIDAVDYINYLSTGELYLTESEANAALAEAIAIYRHESK